MNCPGERSKVKGGLGVVVGKVDRFAEFRVAFADRFSCIMGHRCEYVAALFCHLFADTADERRPFLGRSS